MSNNETVAEYKGKVYSVTRGKFISSLKWENGIMHIRNDEFSFIGTLALYKSKYNIVLIKSFMDC